MSVHDLPFDQLPNPRKVWEAAPNSHEEGLGRLVLLTPEVVAHAAATCIKTGRRTSLAWDMNKLEVANFGRKPAKLEIVSLQNGHAFDDIYTFNPQQSSQWDGLRHYSGSHPDSDERLFYGGTTSAEILDPKNTRIGMQHWAREGICGRGILLDYVRYAEHHNIKYSSFSHHDIPLPTLEAIAAEQGLTIRRGDILFVRVGVTREWDTQMTAKQKQAYAEDRNPLHAGVEGSEAMLRWIWDNGISAVASDSLSFEVYPSKESYLRDGQPEVKGCFMHEYLLAGWGMPIGELFDLERLSEICEEEKTWEFFVASSPLNMPGGVSSPPNCVAIF